MCSSSQVSTVKQAGGIPPEGIIPFNTVDNTLPYAQSYLSGFQADLYSTKLPPTEVGGLKHKCLSTESRPPKD